MERPKFLGLALKPIEKPKTPEEIKFASRKYLAGIFEAGGSFSVNVYEGRIQCGLNFTDVSNETIGAIQKLFDGSEERLKDVRSNRWAITDTQKIASILVGIYEFALSRRVQIESFMEMLGASGQEKIAIGKSFPKERERVSEQEYNELVNDPSFLAGVFDARGHTYFYENYGLHRINMQSKNISLMNAIQKAYQGGEYSHTGKMSLSNGASHKFLHRINPYRIANL